MSCHICGQDLSDFYTNQKGYGTYCSFCKKMVNKLIDAIKREGDKPYYERYDLKNCYIEFKQKNQLGTLKKIGDMD